MENLAIVEIGIMAPEALTCVGSRGIVGFAEAFRNSGAALATAGLLPIGDAFSCRMHVASDGRVDGTLRHLARESTNGSALLAKLGPSIFPGAVCLDGPVMKEQPSLVQIIPRAICGSPSMLRDVASIASQFTHAMSSWPWQIGQALAVLMRAGGGSLELSLRHVARDAALTKCIKRDKAAAVAATYAAPSNEATQERLKASQSMIDDAHLFSVEAFMGGATIGPLERDLVAYALFGTANDVDATAEQASFRSLAGSAHAVARLAPLSGEIEYLRRLQPLPQSDSGWEIGCAGGVAPVRLGPDSRARHLYIIGATGTGKSTLMRSLIGQDMMAGEAIIMIDPHGDLSREVEAMVPPSRRSDVLFADASDVDGRFSISLLPSSKAPDAVERSADNLVRLFTEVLYSDVTNAFGPVFEQYFRNALLLLLAAGPTERTLASLPRIFEDKAFRDLLLGNCGDRAATSFWRETATKANGEMSLANVTPYITSKLTRLVGTSQARRIFRGEGHGIDFAEVMNAGKILILRCPKGDLGEGLTALAMAACLIQIQEAAMARAGSADRRKVRLYIDEFQGARGQSLSTLLAEGRKFGVSLTLANQSLAQIDGTRDKSLGAAILANVANLIVFRVGAPDAQLLAPWLDQPDRWRDLCNLPDFRMRGRILANGRPVSLPELGLPLVEFDQQGQG